MLDDKAEVAELYMFCRACKAMASPDMPEP